MSEEMTNFGPEILNLIDEDGVEHEFELLDELDTDDGEHYIAIFPTAANGEDYIDSDGELIIMKIDRDDPDECFTHIEDEEEFNRISAIFVERLSDEFEFLYPEDEE
ncbi:MAG: DUF1292 domain-containing protein [Oscillospiraceae bacterium]|jgi:uncharacterized protein YrzB (UPF0473 family)|nr:DUF1292 domain-containing protein [Oscillospiraceae bacterium]